MSVPSTYFHNQAVRGHEPDGSYWNDHYNHLYQQYQNYYQPSQGEFDNGEEELVCKRVLEYDKLNIKMENEDSMSCDEQRPTHCGKPGEQVFGNGPSRFYNDITLNHQHNFDNGQAYFDNAKLAMEKTRLPSFQQPDFDKFMDNKDQPKHSPHQEEFLEFPRVSGTSPSMLHFGHEEQTHKFGDIHMHPTFAQQHLRSFTVESNNNGSPLKTPVESKNVLPVDDNRIFPWMKTSFHKGVFLYVQII